MEPISEKGIRGTGTGFEEAPHRVTKWRRFVRVFFGRPVVIGGTVVILALIIVSISAPLLSPYDPYKQQLRNALQHPTWDHWLGTDPLGRDVLSRLIYGTQFSLMVGIIAVGIASVIGMTLGLIAGYFGGWLDLIVMRVIDALLTIPALVLALTFATLLGPGLTNVMIAIGVALMPTYCRLMRGQVLSVKESDYILAVRVVGASNTRIMLRHVVPNCLPPLIVLVTLNLGTAILSEAALSFLGIGINPPAAAWGAMVNDGYRYLLTNPILSFAPGMCIFLVVLSFNMVGDGLRDALDPRLRGTL
jgi:peptide/nickel transport system permease protein